MIGYHCGVRIVYDSETREWFRKRCPKCGRRFTQRKRQASTK